MAEEKKGDSRGERIAKSIINNPYFSALSVAILIFMVSLAIVYIQYNQIQSLADSARSQIDIIENEYQRFKDAKNNYDAIIEDISKDIRKRRLDINDFETIYLNSIILDIETLSESDEFKGNQYGDMFLVLYMLEKRHQELGIFFKRLSSNPKGIDSQLKSRIISANIKLAAQEKVTYFPLNTTQPTFSNQKLKLMEKALKFSGINSSIGNTFLQDACIMILSRYDPLFKFQNEYPMRDLIKTSFELLSIKGSLTEIELKEFIYSNNYNIVRKLFGNNLTKTKIDHLFSMMQSLFKLETVTQRVKYYNDWIIKIWYLSIDNPGIIFKSIEVENFEPKGGIERGGERRQAESVGTGQK